MRTGTPTLPCCSGVVLMLTAALAFTATAGCTGTVGSGGAGTGNTSGGSGTTGSNGGTTGAGNVGGTGNPTGVGGTGSPTGSGGTGTPVTSTCAQVGMDTGAAVLRRLSNLEYQLTLQDLFQLTSPPALDGIPPDVDHDGFRTYAGIQSVTAQHLRAYIDRAHALAEELMADTTRRSRVLGCEPTASGCLRAFVTRFGKLAYRRALQTTEIDGVVNRATADALDVNDQFKFAIEVLLSSSNFLYRVEIGNPAEAVTTLTLQEIASRLSFALWGRAPDATLIDQATAMLGTPDALAATASTMLANVKTRTYYDAFFRQWLGFEGMVAPPNPPAAWTDALVGDMVRETQGVVGDFAWASPSRNFLDVLTAGYTRPTPALATYYGLPSAGSDGTAQFPSTHVRAGTGLLTHPSLLAAKRDGDLISMRGNWLRRTFLCRSLSIDPGVAEMLGELLVGLSRVEIVQKRNTETACAGCHAQIDPVGIGFVQFDHTGRFDATINGAEYGVPAALPDAGGARFNTVAELAGKLRALPELSACLANKVFVYAEGRDPLRADACALESATKSFVDGGSSFPAMLRGLVASSAFRTRRAAGVTP